LNLSANNLNQNKKQGTLYMIKAILFDLDGVLINADKWHFNALNVALQLADIDPVGWQEHVSIYKGIPTRKKLEILTERRGLDVSLWKTIAEEKQNTTVDIIKRFLTPDPEKVEMMRLLSRRFRIIVCSNAKRESLDLMLEKSGLSPFVEFSISNEDVHEPKPDPEIYFKAFAQLGLKAHECVIVEDSDVGKQAARASGGVLCPVEGPQDVNYYRVLATVLSVESPTVVIPAAGQGKRFSEVGYQHPKPLIDVVGKPMISLVLENFAGIGKPVVIMQKRHVDTYCADKVISSLHPGAKVVTVDGLTEGAACTVLSARECINNHSELILANSDQYLDFNISEFVARMRSLGADAGMLTFKSNDPKWSYAKVSTDGIVTEVAEKKVISDQATVGIYYYRRGADFVAAADRMIYKNIRVNNEFYVCPVFNEMIEAGAKVYIHEIAEEMMHGLGTPEDLQQFLRTKETKIIELEQELSIEVIRDSVKRNDVLSFVKSAQSQAESKETLTS
jgi:HAD superfamily hydrolase (TIGR01509 family)